MKAIAMENLPKDLGDDWEIANQRALSEALAIMRQDLVSYTFRRHAQVANGNPDIDQSAVPSPQSAKEIKHAIKQYRDLVASMSPPPALETLCYLFGLSSQFERNVLLLCAAVELDSGIAPLCAAAQGNPQLNYPTFSLALAAFPEAHWSALSLESPLRRWRLIEFNPNGGNAGAPLTTRPLRVDERVLQYLTGIQQLDERLYSLVEPLFPNQELAPSHLEIAHRVAAAWDRSANAPPFPAIFLYGADFQVASAIAAEASSSAGLNLHALSAQALPSTPSELHTLIRLLERESRLSASALLLDCSDAAEPGSGHDFAVNEFIKQVSSALIVVSRTRRQTKQRQAISFEVGLPAAREQFNTWESALGDIAQQLDGRLQSLSSQFNLTVSAIHSVAAEVLTAEKQSKVGQSDIAQPQSSSESIYHLIWEGCRKEARSNLEELAQRIDSAAEWGDLVLPENETKTLRDIVAQVRQRAKVYEEWGFAKKSSRGLGISALFSGQSGTGKTLAAEVLAHELCLDLYRIDLSAVVSKYIGETEKNLRRIFDAAESGGAILLFDEADALFGKRSEVKDSHDRHANIEVSYLLQRMESYRGLAILTTNLKGALDQAFLRRIRFVVQFPFPDTKQRSEIWRRVFPKEVPTGKLDYDRLAQLNVAGGNIRNIALHAAFLAADVGDKVRTSHLLEAARVEYSKLEKTLTETEIIGWDDAKLNNDRGNRYGRTHKNLTKKSI